jgi:hypothetical protein
MGQMNDEINRIYEDELAKTALGLDIAVHGRDSAADFLQAPEGGWNERALIEALIAAFKAHRRAELCLAQEIDRLSERLDNHEPRA